MTKVRTVLIAGPTASGKSALALHVAEQFGGVIINADSMQVYRDLRVITARPTMDEEKRVPHRLYGLSMQRRTTPLDVGAATPKTRFVKLPRRAVCRFWSVVPDFTSRH